MRADVKGTGRPPCVCLRMSARAACTADRTQFCAPLALMKLIKLLRLQNVPILRQLLLEEALLRADSNNWCIVNNGTSVPAIVMGISG